MKLDGLLSIIVAAAAFAADGATPAWPGFRGPNSSGVAAEATPPIDISPTNSVLWKVQVPWSPSSPCIWDDHIFLTTFSDNELQTRCYHRQDGTLAWSQGLKPDKLGDLSQHRKQPCHPHARDGRSTVGQLFRLFWADLLRPQGQGSSRRHPLPVALSGGELGTTSSPLIAGNLVVINRDQDQDSCLLAVDLRTGKTAWETPRPDALGSFGTPILWRNNGVEEVITPGSLRLKGYALKTGLEDWVVQGTARLPAPRR